MSARALGSLAAAGVLLLTTAGPASAAQVTLRDGRGDVWASTAPDTWEPAPSGSLNDVTRTVAKHGANKIAVSIRFVALKRTGSYAQYAIRLQSKRDRRIREVVVEAGPRDWAGQVQVFRANGDPASSCPVTHVIDYGNEKVQVRVDRTCLRSPGAVRINVNAYRAQKDKTFLADNPHGSQAESSAWTGWVRRTA